MAYPIKITGNLRLNQTLTVPFRPEKAGLVKVIVVVTWDDSGGLPSNGHSGETDPKEFFLAVRLDIVKPGSTVPVASSPGRKLVATVPPPHEDLGKPRFVLWADAPAAAADLGADWTANITNTGDVPASYDVTVRYQMVDGNLGKIDHIIVMMMENRSFDHMLGYLRLEKNRTDVDGLTGTESNIDDSNNPHAVHHRTDTYFRNDPGHGFSDVADQLTWPSLVPDSGNIGFVQFNNSNTGFVHNFAKVLDRDAQGLPPQMTTVSAQGKIIAGNSQLIHFRPTQPGSVTVKSVPSPHVAHTETGLLATIVLRRPGSTTPLATAEFQVPSPSMLLGYNATAADLADPGDWTCEVSNESNDRITFATDVTYVQALHDLSKQEPAEAIMGYYNANQLPAYDLLAREFLICDRWFASLPTDTFPNRLYALTGGSDLDQTPSDEDVSKNPPAYTRKTIFEVLQERGVDWKIFFSDLPFALVFKKFAQDAQYTQRMCGLFKGASATDLASAAETGDLPSVAWIDPNFSDFRESAAAASDDHPPGDITNGQLLVQQIYKLLSTSPAWTKTLLLITYDEHGGFYDHVRPPGLSADKENPAPGGPPDDDPRFRRYGVRVPAFVVSPWVPPGSVSHETYDHTSLLSTILHRFCPDAVASMGQRVTHALDVGPLLSLDAPRGEIAQMPGIPSPPPPPPGVARTLVPNSFGDILRKTIFGF